MRPGRRAEAAAAAGLKTEGRGKRSQRSSGRAGNGDRASSERTSLVAPFRRRAHKTRCFLPPSHRRDDTVLTCARQFLR